VATKGSLPLLGPDPNAPRELHLVGRYALGVEWQDSHSSIYPFEFLRESCACMTCAPPEAAAAPLPASPGQPWPIEIKKETSGLRIRWQDGHETTFAGRELRRICRCAACTVRP
jgi:DUF971 family protein